MSTSFKGKKILDGKVWRHMTPNPTTASVAGSCVISSGLNHQVQLIMLSASSCWLYFPEDDGYIQIAASGLAGTWAAGACGTFHPFGPSGTALGGSSNTIQLASALSIPGSIVGFKIRIRAGTGAGSEGTILSHTPGSTNVVCTVDAWTNGAPDNTSTYQLLTGRYYVFCPGATNGFGYYDYATATWTVGLSVAGITASFGTSGKMVATAGINGVQYPGLCSSGGSSTFTNSLKAWATNQFSNWQVRFMSGTGAGQVRTISTNTGTVGSVSAGWTTQPDNTSNYIIEGNDDYLYLIGNNVVTMYRYSIANNTWSTITPGVARAAIPGGGCSLSWANPSDAQWNVENATLAGRYLYSFRGGATNALHVYDISANSWATLVPSRWADTITTGTGWVNTGDSIFFQKDNTGRWFRYDVAYNDMNAITQDVYPQGTSVEGDKGFGVQFTDSAVTVQFLYFILNGQIFMRRMLVF